MVIIVAIIAIEVIGPHWASTELQCNQTKEMNLGYGLVWQLILDNMVKYLT